MITIALMAMVVPRNRAKASLTSSLGMYRTGRVYDSPAPMTSGMMTPMMPTRSDGPRWRQAADTSISRPVSSRRNNTPNHATVDNIDCWI